MKTRLDEVIAQVQEKIKAENLRIAYCQRKVEETMKSGLDGVTVADTIRVYNQLMREIENGIDALDTQLSDLKYIRGDV